MDFTFKFFNQLILSLKKKSYNFLTFKEFITVPAERSVILRHDVDRLPLNALKIAELEERSGVKGSYYFRSVKESFDEKIIKQIAGMGHEVGYHYENLATIGKKMKLRIQDTGDRGPHRELYELAIEDFEENLKKFREIVPVKTICMHGSPTSKFDSRDLWKKYNYRDYGIIGEPYFDIDFSKVLYLTDTGRRWDGERYNIRDRVIKKSEENKLSSNIKLHSTFDIIDALEKNLLPDQIMINTHPQRWTDDMFPWVKELVWQSFKNQIKRRIRK